MDKNAIKKYAVWARTELIERVRQRASQFEITADAELNAESVNGKILSDVEKKQRQAAIAHVKEKGYEHVIEEAAYTWFNRFAALRYMEVNNVLPSRIRIFTDENGTFNPQILTEAIHLNLDGLNINKVYILKEQEANEELYKYLLITQCNALSSVLPGMFQRIDDYTELLFPDNLLREGSVAEQMVSQIPEENWKDAVQIIGWLYQYYNSEPKDKVFADLKKNIKITKETLPAATQLFTPDWIVRYMVENSLGRLWIEGHPNEKLKDNWKYYLEEAKQEPEVQANLSEIRKEYSELKPEDIKALDPCCGSGHILTYMFDVLMQIYTEYGYSTRDSVRSIIDNNLFGLDIDKRAVQLSYFSMMMKAIQYDNYFLKRTEIPQPHIYVIKESNNLDNHVLNYFCNQDPLLISTMDSLVEEMHDAGEYGSLIRISPVDFERLYRRFNQIKDDINLFKKQALDELLPMVQVAELLRRKYNTVVTNPPYMGNSGMNSKLSSYVKKHYPDSKSDLFAVFIERCLEMTTLNGFQAMITQHAWMFLTSFEKLREKLLSVELANMIHLGARAFDEIGGEVVQTTSFVICKIHQVNYQGTYLRLLSPSSQKGKEEMFFSYTNRYTANQENFVKIPGSPIAYWISNKLIDVFKNKKIGEISIPKQGMIPGNVNEFLRIWHEVDFKKIGFNHKQSEDIKKYGFKWFPYNKGGSYRKWFGNIEFLIDMENDGFAIKHSGKNNNYRLRDPDLYFQEAVTWSKISSGDFSARFMSTGYLFDIAGCCIFQLGTNINYVLGYLNSKVNTIVLNIISPTLNYEVDHIKKLPIKIDESKEELISTLVKSNIAISKLDWDFFESSWEFSKHPLINNQYLNNNIDTSISGYAYSLNNLFLNLKTIAAKRFNNLHSNEEKLNKLFIEINDLQNEFSPVVESQNVTVHYIVDEKKDAPEDLQKSNYLLTKQDIVKSLVSYSIGCIFGRYSLDEEGLIYAGGDWDASRYQKYPADQDNILPICDDEYFEDDIVGLFVDFIKTVYGENTLEENLQFIADALGGKGTPREVIRSYFLNDFYKDHCKAYKKRPIYWLFDSGKKNGFKALIYMHRYQPDTIARMRTDYVHEQQSRYWTAISDIDNRMINVPSAERVRLNKQLIKLQDQSAEIHEYEEKIHHLADQMIDIDLDDGVKYNYALFQDVLAKIK